uniref:Uncharacterized protein n=1 Tax=Sphaerodactylus townsendi TaxID=933632 RepID=A0ACB8G9X5_9SAUR
MGKNDIENEAAHKQARTIYQGELLSPREENAGFRPLFLTHHVAYTVLMDRIMHIITPVASSKASEITMTLNTIYLLPLHCYSLDTKAPFRTYRIMRFQSTSKQLCIIAKSTCKQL